jgi:hypothetical protein
MERIVYKFGSVDLAGIFFGVCTDPNSYGFRPKRSTADALQQCFNTLCRGCSPQWVLEGDIKGCLDRSSYYTYVNGVVGKSCGCWSNACIRGPFCRPPDTWTTESSPRFTRCMIVCRDTLYYQKTRLTLKNCGSRGCSIVVVEHSAEFFSALDVTHLGQRRRRLDQLVLDPLMIAPLAIIVDEGRDGGPQLLLA